VCITISLDQISCRESGLTDFTPLEDVIKRQLKCSFLPFTIQFFITRNSTLIHPDNFQTPLPNIIIIIIIIIYDANGSVNVLKNAVSCSTEMCLTGFTSEDSSSSSFSAFSSSSRFSLLSPPTCGTEIMCSQLPHLHPQIQ
jgi:hypothetical protein